MTEAWVTIAGLAVGTAAIKAFGPVTAGGRELSPRAAGVIALVAPALLAALVVTQVFADGSKWAVEESAAGVAVAGVVVWRGGSVIACVVVAAAVTAGLRAL